MSQHIDNYEYKSRIKIKILIISSKVKILINIKFETVLYILLIFNMILDFITTLIVATYNYLLYNVIMTLSTDRNVCSII